MNYINAAVIAATLALLGACGSATDPQAETAQASAPKPAAPAAKPADPTARMARAVGSGKVGAAVEIRYEFASKPSVGSPTEVQLAFIPQVGVDSLDVSVSGMEGITLAGPLTAKFDGVEAGKPYTHTVSVLPDRNGVFYLTVNANTQISGSTLGRTFAVPFAVGEVQAQKKADPPKDSTGQAIQSMPAQETKGS